MSRPDCLSECRRFLLPLLPTSILWLGHIYFSAVLSAFKLSSLTLLCVSPLPLQHFGVRSRRANCPPRFRCSRYPFQQVRQLTISSTHTNTHNRHETKNMRERFFFSAVSAVAVTASVVDLHSVVRKKRQLALRRKRAAINLPLRGLNNLCQRGEYKSRRAETRRSCGTLAQLVFITQISARVCVCEKKSAPHPSAMKLNTGRRRKKRGILFVNVSLLIDASHKTSTIRDHSSSFLPLLLTPPGPPAHPTPPHPTLILFTLSPAATPSFLPLPPSVFPARWRRHTGFHAAACHVGSDPGGVAKRVAFANELRDEPKTGSFGSRCLLVRICNCSQRKSRGALAMIDKGSVSRLEIRAGLWGAVQPDSAHGGI